MIHSRAAKILIYCQDSLGLGHLRRNINIAHEISCRAAGTQILFVADSPLAPFFKLPANSDFVKLPTVVKIDAGVWQAHRLPFMQIERAWQLRAQLIREIAYNYEPDVLLVDHMPHGAQRELLPCLEMLREEYPQTQIVVGLRDILGAPEAIIKTWLREDAYTTINTFYDKVLVYGSPDYHDLATACELSTQVNSEIHYCGYVSPNPENTAAHMEPLASLFPTPKPYNLLVMGGGGSDAHFFMDTFLSTLRLLGDNAPFNALILTGPFMPIKDQQALIDKAANLPVIVRRMESDSLEHLQQADMVISMAGYNTTCEILAFRKKAIMVPRSGPSAEQGMRCQILHERGLIYSIHPHQLTPAILAEAIEMRIHEPHDEYLLNYPPLDGASKVAELLLNSIPVATNVFA